MPGHLVGHDDVADAQPGLSRTRQQLVAGAERVPDGRLIGDDDGVVTVGDLRVVEDEAATDGVERPLCQRRTGVVEGPQQRQRSGVRDGGDPFGGAVGVDRVGPLPHQAEGDGGDAAVALAGRAERAEQFDGDPPGRVELLVLRQPAGEPVGGDHRADGV